jgi:MFS family permease
VTTPAPTPAPTASPATSPRTPFPGARASLALLLGINLLNYLDRYVLSAVEPLIRAEFFAKDDPTANTKMGLLATAFMVTYMAAAPVFGWLADRMRRWLLISIGVAVWSLASGGSGLAMSFSALLLLRIAVGIGEAAYGPSAPALISDMYPVERRGTVLSWFYVAIPVGSALGFVLGGAVAQAFTWHWAFLITAPPGLLLAFLCLFRKEPPRGGADAGSQNRRAGLRDYVDLLRIPSYTLGVAGMTAFTFALGGISFWMPTYVHEHRGQPDLAHVNLIFGGITVVAGLTATLTGGWLADRLRARLPGSYFLVSAGGMVLGLPLFLATLYLPFPAAWFTMAGAIFCLFLNTGPSNTALLNVTHPSVRATAFALSIFAIHALGDAISPPIIGAITDATRSEALPKGSMTTAFLLMAFMMALSAALWFIAARFLERDTREAPTRLAPGADR